MLKKVLPKLFFLTCVAKQNEKQRQMCEAAFDFLQWQKLNRGGRKKKEKKEKKQVWTIQFAQAERNAGGGICQDDIRGVMQLINTSVARNSAMQQGAMQHVYREVCIFLYIKFTVWSTYTQVDEHRWQAGYFACVSQLGGARNSACQRSPNTFPWEECVSVHVNFAKYQLFGLDFLHVLSTSG